MSESKDKKDFSYCDKHDFPAYEHFGLCVYCGWTYEELVARREAAVTLKVPMSGTPWLDEMIEASRRDEFAKSYMASGRGDYFSDPFYYVDALLAASKVKKEGE